MGKAILFLRVSTQSQDLDSQEMKAKRMALSYGYKEEDILPPIKYKESAVKLGEADRQGLQDLYSIIEHREDVETIFVTELSRLSRREIVLYSIRDFLIQRQIQLVCGSPEFKLLDDNKKMDPQAQITFSLFGCFAAQEAVEKKVRFARGKEQKAKENKFSGGNIPYGYKVEPKLDKLIVVDEKDSALVQEVFDLYENGQSQTAIARYFLERGNSRLNLAMVNNILTNERYTGSLKVYPGSSYPRQYPQIISKEQYEHCRSIAKENNTRADKTRNVYYAHNLIVCPECGCKWSASGSQVSYRCYDAHNNANRKLGNYRTPQCTNKLEISINIVDSLIWYIAQKEELNFILDNAASQKTENEKKIAEVDAKLEGIQIRFEAVEEKQRRCVKMYINGKVSEEDNDKNLADIDNEKRALRAEKVACEEDRRHFEALISAIESKYALDTVDETVSHLDRIIQLQQKIEETSNDAERSEIIHRHIKKITVQNKTVDYTFGVGERVAKARFLTILLHNGTSLYYYYLPNTGTGGIVLKTNVDGTLREKVDVPYLKRYVSKKKARLRAEKKSAQQKEKDSLYPSEKYIFAYSGLAKFLKVNISTAYRYVEVLGVLKPAVAAKYNGQIVVDKAKCLKLMEQYAENNVWAMKIINSLKK